MPFTTTSRESASSKRGVRHEGLCRRSARTAAAENLGTLPRPKASRLLLVRCERRTIANSSERLPFLLRLGPGDRQSTSLPPPHSHTAIGQFVPGGVHVSSGPSRLGCWTGNRGRYAYWRRNQDEEIVKSHVGRAPMNLDISALRHDEIVYESVQQIREELERRGVPPVLIEHMRDVTASKSPPTDSDSE